MKKQTDKVNTFGTLAAMLCIFSVIILYAHGITGVAALRTPTDLYAEDTDIGRLSKLTPVKAEIYMSLDYFLEETTTRTSNDQISSIDKDYYYIIPAFSGEDTYFIGLKVKAKDKKTYDEIVENTYAYFMNDSEELGETTAMVQGCLRDMDFESYGYFKDWFKDSEWFADDKELEKYVLPMYLEPVNLTNSRVMFIAAGIGLAAGIIFAVLFFKGKAELSKAAPGANSL